jgi:hypothetical protein
VSKLTIYLNPGRKPVHTIPDELVEKIIELRNSEKYKNSNFLHFQELLREHENIKISYKPLYNILTNAGFKSPKKRRKTKAHHRRKRKAQEGLLVQMDATPFNWFGDKQNYALHGAIDDATDHTQFERAMSELGITLIPARSPQAKGRVERLWDTLQSRLPVEFKIVGITNIHEANQFLLSYIPKFNEKFAVKPANSEVAYTPLKKDLVVDNILCFKQIRTIDNGGVFSFKGKHFQSVSNGQIAYIPPKSQVEVLISPVFGVRVKYKNTVYEVVPFIKPKKTKTPTPAKQKSTYRPPDHHYYKYGRELWPKLSFAESDSEILQMLEEIFLKKYA